jgi:hypothetical protein
LQRGGPVEAGPPVDDEEEGGVRDAERPAPGDLADGEDDERDAEGGPEDLQEVQGSLLRTARRA